MKLYSDDEDSSSDEEVGASDFDPIQLNDLLNEDEKLNQSMLEDIIQAQEQIRRREEGDHASNKEIVAALDEDQPKPLGVDTSAPYYTDLECEDRNDAKQWFIDKGIENKCVLVLGRRSKKDRLDIVCERGGKKESHWEKDIKYVKKTTREYITKSKKYECPFKIIVPRHETPNGTRVYKLSKVKNGCHNHDDPESLVGHAAVCGLKPHQLETVRSIKACRPSDILKNIKEDDKDNLSTLRQIYTARAAFRRNSWNGREVMEQSQWLADQHGYTMRKKLLEGKLTRIFLSHPEMQVGTMLLSSFVNRLYIQDQQVQYVVVKHCFPYFLQANVHGSMWVYGSGEWCKFYLDVRDFEGDISWRSNFKDHSNRIRKKH